VNVDQAEGDDDKSYFVITDFLAVSGGYSLSCELSTSFISYACVSQICAYCSMRICNSLAPSPNVVLAPVCSCLCAHECVCVCMCLCMCAWGSGGGQAERGAERRGRDSSSIGRKRRR